MTQIHILRNINRMNPRQLKEPTRLITKCSSNPLKDSKKRCLKKVDKTERGEEDPEGNVHITIQTSTGCPQNQVKRN